MFTYINGFTLSLALKQRLEAAQKWPIEEEHSVIAVPAKCITDDDCSKGEAVCLRGECHCTNPLARGDGRLICDSYREYFVIGMKAFKEAFRLRERGFKIAKRRRGKMKGKWREWGEILRRLSLLLIPRVALAWFARRFFAFSPTTNLFPGYTGIRFITSNFLLVELSPFLFFLSFIPFFSWRGGGGEGGLGFGEGF